MAHALNLTMKIKQDPATLAKLAAVKAAFATQIQPKIEAALRDSKIVHFARVLVIDDLYLQVLTEYDGDHADYTEFFRRELPDVFATLFSLAENAPDASAMGDKKAFFDFSAALQYRSLGESSTGDLGSDGKVAGYLFSAIGDTPVDEILPKLG